MKILESLAKLCAILAGVLLTAITLMTCVSLIGRNTVGWTIVGDFELSGAAAGAAIALFMPWCQFRRGNIIVDFFTTRARARTQALLDRAGAALLALVMALLTWRTALMLGVPERWVYAAMVPALALTALIAAVQAARGFERAGSPA